MRFSRMLDFILCPSGRGSKGGSGSHASPIQKLPIRPFRELDVVRHQHGTPFMAAASGAINAEEYLKLEKLGDH